MDTRLRDEARSQNVDLTVPENAFTLWAVSKSFISPCGGRADLDSIWNLARRHTQLKGLYILPADPKKFAIAVPDDDRVKEPKR